MAADLRDATSSIAAVLVLVLVLGSACTPRRSVELPPEIAYVAALVQDEAGAVIAGTPLIRSEDASLFAENTESMIIAGYTAQDLAPFQIRLDAADDPLRLAAGCEAPLPVPAFAAQAAGASGRFERVDAASLPKLTSSWADGSSCDLDLERVRADIRCTIRWCPTEVTRDGCSLILDFTSCAGPRAEVRVHPDGELCMSPQRNPERCEISREGGASWFSLECATPRTCTYEIHRVPERSRFSVRRLEVLDVEPRLSMPDDTFLFDSDDRFSGYLADFLVLGDRLIVLINAGWREGQRCAGDDPSSIAIFDRVSLRRVGTSTAPACSMRLSADPAGGFFVLHGARRSFGLMRFSADARPLEARAIEFPLAPDIMFPMELVTHGVPPRAIAHFGSLDQGDSPLELQVAIDPVTLASTSTRSFRNAKIRAIAPIGRSELALADDIAFRMLWIDALTGEPTRPATVQGGLLVVPGAAVHAHHPASELTVAATVRSITAIFTIDREDEIVQRDFYELDAVPSEISRWPPDPRVMLIASTHAFSQTRAESLVTLFDPVAQRFLPGTQPIGHGQVGRIREDGARGVWLMLPWAAELVELTPAE